MPRASSYRTRARCPDGCTSLHRSGAKGHSGQCTRIPLRSHSRRGSSRLVHPFPSTNISRARDRRTDPKDCTRARLGSLVQGESSRARTRSPPVDRRHSPQYSRRAPIRSRAGHRKTACRSSVRRRRRTAYRPRIRHRPRSWNRPAWLPPPCILSPSQWGHISRSRDSRIERSDCTRYRHRRKQAGAHQRRSLHLDWTRRRHRWWQMSHRPPIQGWPTSSNRPTLHEQET